MMKIIPLLLFLFIEDLFCASPKSDLDLVSLTPKVENIKIVQSYPYSEGEKLNQKIEPQNNKYKENNSDNIYTQAELKYIEDGNKIKLGDKIITNSYSDMFPEGLIIGSVIDITNKKNSLFVKVDVLLPKNLDNSVYLQDELTDNEGNVDFGQLNPGNYYYDCSTTIGGIDYYGEGQVQVTAGKNLELTLMLE